MRRCFVSVRIVSVFLCFLAGSCRTVRKSQTVIVIASGSPKHPVQTSIGEFFVNYVHWNFTDTEGRIIKYAFIPGEKISINRDTSLYLFFPDTLIADSRRNSLFTSSNPRNIAYTRLLEDITDSANAINSQRRLFFDNDKRITEDEWFIDSVLAGNDMRLQAAFKYLGDKHNIPESDAVAITATYFGPERIGTSFFYFSRLLPLFDSLGILEKRLDYYRDRVNAQEVSTFSQHSLAFSIMLIAREYTGTGIGTLTNNRSIEEYYKKAQQHFSGNTICRDFLASAVTVQAKKQGIRLSGSKFHTLRKDAKKSRFRKFVLKKYSSPEDRIPDAVTDRELYTPGFKSSNLEDILSGYKGKPLVIDFWASWCNACIQDMPKLFKLKDSLPALNILFVSVDRSQEGWKQYLFDHDLKRFPQFRQNFRNQHKIFTDIPEIPKYGLLQADGALKLMDKIDQLTLAEYVSTFR